MQGSPQELWSTREIARLLSLVESERRYFQEIVASLPVAVALVRPDLGLASVNQAFRDMFGLPLTVKLEEQALDRVVALDELRSHSLGVLQTGQAFTVVYPRVATSHGVRPVRLSLRPLRNWENPAFSELLVVVENLSNPYVDNLIATSHIQHVPVIFWTVDPARMVFLTVGGPGLATIPVPRDVWTPDACFWSGRVAGADMQDVRNCYQMALAGGVIRSCDYRAVSTGGEVLWLRDVIGIERSAEGNPARIYGVTFDVTCSRRREDSAAQHHKVAALSRLASLVAHECNNLLMIMGGYGEELTNGLNADDPLRSNVQEILYAGDRLSALTRQLTDFVRRPSADLKSMPVDAWLADLHWHLRQEVPRSIELLMSLKSAGATAVFDPDVLAQVLQQIAQRAVESMASGGTLTIETKPFDLPDVITGNRSPVPAGAYVQLAIHDTGPVIPPNNFLKLFEPSVNGEGTRHNFGGLYAAVREMRGDITVTSDAEHGTTFCILLPRASTDTPSPETKMVEAQPVPAPATVMVVEDERRIRTLICKILSRYGYRTIEAGDGREGLELARSHTETIELLLTDVVMPGIGGVELAKALREIRPEMKVLFISGYPGATGAPESQVPSAAFLQKPFTLQSLVAKVRETLGAARSGSAAAD
ncbi:MAG: response regulator [Bryobacterales bacterium]|nr:response regulator [Bryobacterales bacterium]